MNATRLPIFPLSTVLYPEALLPLQIFEPRYLDMVSDCMKNASAFGVCLARPAGAGDQETGHEKGNAARCLALGASAEIIDWTQRDNGLLGITVKGVRRFRLLGSTVRKDNLLVGEVAWLDEQQGDSELPGMNIIRRVYADILDNYDTPYNDDTAEVEVPGAVACYRLADLLPIDLVIKQRILEAADLQRRMDIILAVLRSADIITASDHSSTT